MDVARSAPQGAHYHADVVVLLLLLQDAILASAVTYRKKIEDDWI